MNDTLTSDLEQSKDLEFVGVGTVNFTPYSTEVYWRQEVPFAVTVLLYCSFFIVLQFLVMRVMYTDRDLRKLPAFQIMFMISFFDTIQLFIHLTAVYQILSSKLHFGFLDYLIGAVMNASWVTMLILSICLNVNRLISIVFHFQSERVFSPFAMKIYLAICLFIWLIFFLLNATGLSHMVYLLPAYTWHYVAANPLSATLRSLSADISLLDVVFSLFAHTGIFTYIYLKAAILSKKELLLSVQVLCVSIFHVLGYITWEYLPIPWELPIGVFMGHFVWMTWNSINPMLYILINPRIRSLVLISLGQQPDNSRRTLFQPSHISSLRNTNTSNSKF